MRVQVVSVKQLSHLHNTYVKYFSINDIVRELGDVTRALPFFYAFTGCDTTPSIFNKGNCKCWQNNERKVDITSTFLSLGSLPHRVANYQINTLEYYIIILYSTNPTTLTSERVSHFERSVDNDLRKNTDVSRRSYRTYQTILLSSRLHMARVLG